MGRPNEGYRLHAWDGELHWERWTIADPGPGEVQVAVEACGVGLTVLDGSAHGLRGASPHRRLAWRLT